MDRIAKIGLLLLGVGFLWSYYSGVPNDRYKAIPYDGPGFMVLDSRQGKYYHLNYDESSKFSGLEIDPVHNRITGLGQSEIGPLGIPVPAKTESESNSAAPVPDAA